MATCLVHMRVKEGQAAAFEALARRLYAASTGHEPGMRRYEYWRGREPNSYYCLESFDDYAGFLAHETASYHEAAAEPINAARTHSRFDDATRGEIRIAAEDAQFTLPEPKVGVSIDAGGDLRLSHEIDHLGQQSILDFRAEINMPSANIFHRRQLMFWRGLRNDRGKSLAGMLEAMF